MSKLINKTSKKTRFCLMAISALAAAFFLKILLGNFHINLANVGFGNEGGKFFNTSLIKSASADTPTSPITYDPVDISACCGCCGGGCASSAGG